MYLIAEGIFNMGKSGRFKTFDKAIRELEIRGKGITKLMEPYKGPLHAAAGADLPRRR